MSELLKKRVEPIKNELGWRMPEGESHKEITTIHRGIDTVIDK
jgi:hypothetical protein